MNQLYVCEKFDKNKCITCRHGKPHHFNILLSTCEKGLCNRINIEVKCVKVFKDIIFIKENEFMI